jgi:hypothetical protein
MIGASLADKIQENNTLKSDRRKPGHKLLPSNQIWIELNNTVYRFIVEAIKTKDNKHILHGYTRDLRLHPLDELRVKIVFKKEQDGSHMGEGGEWFPESVHIFPRPGVETTYQSFDYTIRAKEIHIKIPSLSDRSSYWLS